MFVGNVRNVGDIMNLILNRFLARLNCYLNGHDPDYSTTSSNIPCLRCGIHDIDYSDLVLPSRIKLFQSFLKKWLFRKWMPEPCGDCGLRFKHDYSVDHIPF